MLFLLISYLSVFHLRETNWNFRLHWSLFVASYPFLFGICQCSANVSCGRGQSGPRAHIADESFFKSWALNLIILGSLCKCAWVFVHSCKKLPNEEKSYWFFSLIIGYLWCKQLLKICRLSWRALKRLHSQQNPEVQLQRSGRHIEKGRKMSWDYTHFREEQAVYSAREVTIWISLQPLKAADANMDVVNENAEVLFSTNFCTD